MMTAVAMGIPPESAIKAATINPAKSIGIDNIVGSIEPGKRADILCLDPAGMKRVIFGGQEL